MDELKEKNEGLYFKTIVTFFLIWLSAWGIWSLKVPYFLEDLIWSPAFSQESSFTSFLNTSFLGQSFMGGIGYFERPLYSVYHWVGYNLTSPAQHLILTFFHFLSACLFWVLLRKIKIPYVVSLCTACTFLTMPIAYEGILWPNLAMPPQLFIFFIICLLYLRFRQETRSKRLIMYAVTLNLLLFYICLGHPFTLPSIIFIAIFEMILSLKEFLKWRPAIKKTIKKMLPLSIGPAAYAALYLAFPHTRNANLNILKALHSFLSVQYYGAKAFVSMFSREWISISFRALTSNFWYLAIFILTGIVFYRACFRGVSGKDNEPRSLRLIGIDVLWGYLWMIAGFSIYMLDVGFASHSRSYYLPSLGMSIMAGAIVHILYRKLANKRLVSTIAFLWIMMLVFIASGAADIIDRTPKLWRAALIRNAFSKPQS